MPLKGYTLAQFPVLCKAVLLNIQLFHSPSRIPMIWGKAVFSQSLLAFLLVTAKHQAWYQMDYLFSSSQQPEDWGYAGLSNLSKLTNLVSGGSYQKPRISILFTTILYGLQIPKSHFYWCKIRPIWRELLKLVIYK